MAAAVSTVDNDRKWILRNMEAKGAEVLRNGLYSEERSSAQFPMTPEECIALKSQFGIGQTLMRRLHNRSLLHGQNG